MATTVSTRLEANEQVVLPNVSWETYEKLLEDLADCSVPHLTYDQGRLLIVSPSAEHDQFRRALEFILQIFAVEVDVNIRALGSTTFKRKDLERGFEPDSCFYIKSGERIRGKKRLDLSVDPPPDLVIEIDITSSSIPKLPILANFGVPEVWRYNGRSLRMSMLEGTEYVPIDRSVAFPLLTPSVVEEFLAKSQEWEDNRRLVRAIKDWLTENR